MLGKQVTKVGNYLDKSVLKKFTISAMLGFSGGINGNSAVSFTKEHSIAVVSSLLQEMVDPNNEEVINDGVGEMVNMIVGMAKTLMAGKTDINIALPIIIMGDGHAICVREGTPQVFLIYKADEHLFSIQLAFKIES